MEYDRVNITQHNGMYSEEEEKQTLLTIGYCNYNSIMGFIPIRNPSSQ